MGLSPRHLPILPSLQHRPLLQSPPCPEHAGHLPDHPSTSSTEPQTPGGPEQPRKHLKTLRNTATPSQRSPGHQLGLGAPGQPRQLRPLALHTRKTWRKQEEKRNTATELAPKGGTSSSPSSPRLQVLVTLPGGNGEDNTTWLRLGGQEGGSAAPGRSPWPFPTSRHPATLRRHGMPTQWGTQMLPQHLHPWRAVGLRVPAERARRSESQGSVRPPRGQELLCPLSTSQPAPGSRPATAAVAGPRRRAAGLQAPQPPSTGTFLDSWRHQSSTQYCYCAKWELYSLL